MSAGSYKRKEAPIAALQYSGENIEEAFAFLGGPQMSSATVSPEMLLMYGAYLVAYRSLADGSLAAAILVPTRQGSVKAYKSDWIVKDVRGDYDVVSNEDFKQDFEAAQ